MPSTGVAASRSRASARRSPAWRGPSSAAAVKTLETAQQRPFVPRRKALRQGHNRQSLCVALRPRQLKRLAAGARPAGSDCPAPSRWTTAGANAVSVASRSARAGNHRLGLDSQLRCGPVEPVLGVCRDSRPLSVGWSSVVTSPARRTSSSSPCGSPSSVQPSASTAAMAFLARRDCLWLRARKPVAAVTSAMFASEPQAPADHPSAARRRGRRHRAATR